MTVKQFVATSLSPFKNVIIKFFGLVFTVLAWPPRTLNRLLIFTVDFVLSTTKTVLQKLLFTWTIFIMLIGISLMLYAIFYTMYVPTAEISRPAHLSFSACPSGEGICSFPSANVTFWNDEGTVREVLGSGQAYTVMLELEMPDSQSNRDLGMFMVVIKMFDREGQISTMSQRSVSISSTALYKYRSVIMRVMDIVVFSPFYLFGLLEQKQTLVVEMFSHFVDNYYQPSVGARVEVHSHKVEIYSTTLKLFAKFTGLKYFLYYWPMTSALCAVWINLSILLTGLAVVLYQRSETMRKMAQALQLSQNKSDKNDNDDEDESLDIDDEETSLLQTTTDEKDSNEQSTQTKSSEDDDPEMYDLPLLQEPADFATPEGNEDFMSELRHRRIN